MSNDGVQDKKSMSTWLKALLVVSLAFNMLVIGAIGARIFFAPQGVGMWHLTGPARPGALFNAGRTLMREVPLPRRAELFKLALAHRRPMRQALAEIARTRRELARTIAAKPFNEQDFRTALEKVLKAERRAHVLGHKLSAQFILALDERERALFARFLVNPPRRRHWRWRNRNGYHQ